MKSEKILKLEAILMGDRDNVKDISYLELFIYQGMLN